MNPISLNPIILRVNLHPRPDSIEFHIRLADIPTVLDGLDAFLKVVGCDCTGCDGSRRDEEDGC